jgi:hypothetical protein
MESAKVKEHQIKPFSLNDVLSSRKDASYLRAVQEAVSSDPICPEALVSEITRSASHLWQC